MVDVYTSYPSKNYIIKQFPPTCFIDNFFLIRFYTQMYHFSESPSANKVIITQKGKIFLKHLIPKSPYKVAFNYHCG